MPRRIARLAGSALAALLGLLGAPRDSAAQACCTATGAGEFGVVGPRNKAVLAAQLSYERALGGYDPSGGFRSLEGAAVDDVVLALGAGARLWWRPLQLHASVPLRWQHRDPHGAGDSSQLRPGDLRVGLRWTVLRDPMRGISPGEARSYLPFVDLILATKAPTGTAPEDSHDATGADISGDGAWQLMGGLRLNKLLTRSHALRLGCTYAHRFARRIEGTAGSSRSFEAGGEWALLGGWDHLPDPAWSYGLRAELRLTGAAREDDRPVPDSATRRMRFGAQLTRGFAHATWASTLALTVDPWWRGGGLNQPFVGPTLALSVQRNF